MHDALSMVVAVARSFIEPDGCRMPETLSQCVPSLEQLLPAAAVFSVAGSPGAGQGLSDALIEVCQVHRILA